MENGKAICTYPSDESCAQFLTSSDQIQCTTMPNEATSVLESACSLIVSRGGEAKYDLPEPISSVNLFYGDKSFNLALDSPGRPVISMAGSGSEPPGKTRCDIIQSSPRAGRSRIECAIDDTARYPERHDPFPAGDCAQGCTFSITQDDSIHCDEDGCSIVLEKELQSPITGKLEKIIPLVSKEQKKNGIVGRNKILAVDTPNPDPEMGGKINIINISSEEPNMIDLWGNVCCAYSGVAEAMICTIAPDRCPPPSPGMLSPKKRRKR